MSYSIVDLHNLNNQLQILEVIVLIKIAKKPLP